MSKKRDNEAEKESVGESHDAPSRAALSASDEAVPVPELADGEEEQVDLIVQVDRDHSVSAMVDELENLGLKVERALEITRTIGGVGPAELVEKAEKIPGIKRIRRSRTFKVPPLSDKFPQ